MAGVGANMVLDKGWLVISTYNSSAATGVQKFRCVKAGATAGTIDISVADTDITYGVVQEDIDVAKVATGKATANVRMMGITTVVCTTAATVALGTRVTPTTGGGVKAAAVGDIPLGIVVGITGTLADGNLIQVLLTPGMTLIA